MAGTCRAVVCHITVVHAPFDLRIFQKECLTLVEAGYEVHLIACHDRDEVVQGVHIHALPQPSGRLVRVLFWPWRAVLKVLSLRPRPAICHFHNLEFLPAGAVLRLLGFTVIYDVHENMVGHILQKDYLPLWLRRAAALAYRLTEPVLTWRMASVHVLDNIAARYPQPRVVVRNLPQLAPLRPRPRRNSDRLRLIYAGSISEDRGILTMVEAAAELVRRGADVELRLGGLDWEPGLTQRIRDAAARACLGDRFSMFGPVPYDQVQEEIAAADIGLSLIHPRPNYLNSLPVKVLDYMQLAIPVVVSDFECLREYVAGAGTGLQVDPLDVNAIADAIERLARDPTLRHEMGRRGREAVEHRYNWGVEKARLLDFYERLLAL